MHAFLDALTAAFNDTFRNLGHITGGLPKLLAAVLIVLVFVVIARYVSEAIDQAGRLSPRLHPNLRLLVSRLISVGIVTFGVAVGLGVLGLSLTTMAASLGVVGLIVGFALKDMLENFIGGVLILWRRPFEVADQIQVGDNSGTVWDINFRSTTLQTPDGVEVLIPNAKIFNQPVHNLTHYGARRTTVIVKLPADAEPEHAQRLLVDLVASVDGVLPVPPPEAPLLGGAPDAYELSVRYWTKPDVATVNEVESRVRLAIAGLLAETDLRDPGATAIDGARAERPGTS